MFIITFIIILAVIILVHEFGHFIVAKKSGIRVDEFGLGFPPRAWGKKFGDTLYSLNWIPFGGFVKIFGEDPHDKTISEKDKPSSFYYKPRYIQALVLLAGVTFNILFAAVLFSIGFMIGQPATPETSQFGTLQNPQLTITAVLPGSPAQKSGLQAGDKLLFVDADQNGIQASKKTGQLTADDVYNTVIHSEGNLISVLFQRGDGPPQTAFIHPTDGIIPGHKAVGISMDTVGTLKLPFHLAIVQGIITTGQLGWAIAGGLFHFIWTAVTMHTGFSQVSGPIGIAGEVKQASALGFVYVLSFAALISLNLAVINLIPFPALDGGRLLFVIIEAIIRRPIPHTVTKWVNMIGFLVLIILMVVITTADVIKLF